MDVATFVCDGNPFRDTSCASFTQWRHAEARLAATAAKATDVPVALAECSSGRELAAAGHGNDVTLAAQLDTSSTVPVLRKGILEAW